MMVPHLFIFTPLDVGGIRLKNRLTMAPLYLGYAGLEGVVTPGMLEHYALMARSGVALVVVENASVDHPVASGSVRELRADTDGSIAGLTRLAQTIKAEGAVACLKMIGANKPALCARWPREKHEAWKDKVS
jgi:NADPH2 dehydrogenase